MMFGFPENTTRSCSWTASDRICGLSVISVQVGDASSQFVVFQMPLTLPATYITAALLGSDAAASTRPEKGPAPGAGPIGVHWSALKMIDGDGPLSARSNDRPTMTSAVVRSIRVTRFMMMLRRTLTIRLQTARPGEGERGRLSIQRLRQPGQQRGLVDRLEQPRVGRASSDVGKWLIRPFASREEPDGQQL